jgi:hypothetical protein
VDAWYFLISGPLLFPPTSFTPTWDRAISTSFSSGLLVAGFLDGGTITDGSLDSDGKLGKDGAGPAFDSMPSSFRINFHMG